MAACASESKGFAFSVGPPTEALLTADAFDIGPRLQAYNQAYSTLIFGIKPQYGVRK